LSLTTLPGSASEDAAHVATVSNGPGILMRLPRHATLIEVEEKAHRSAERLTIEWSSSMSTCFAVVHLEDDQILQSSEHSILQAIADEASLRFEPGFAGRSYLEVPGNDDVKHAVEARLEQNRMSFSVLTRIA
jgi:hypothetical protein